MSVLTDLKELRWRWFGPRCEAASHGYSRRPRAAGYTRIWGIIEVPLCRQHMEYLNS